MTTFAEGTYVLVSDGKYENRIGKVKTCAAQVSTRPYKQYLTWG